MDDIFETRIKNYKDNEQDDLNIENFKPLSNKNKDDSITDPLTMNLQKFTLKKSASYVSPNLQATCQCSTTPHGRPKPASE